MGLKIMGIATTMSEHEIVKNGNIKDIGYLCWADAIKVQLKDSIQSKSTKLGQSISKISIKWEHIGEDESKSNDEQESWGSIVSQWWKKLLRIQTIV